MTLDEKLSETFAPIAVPADLPGSKARAQLMQNPSDALRDAARAFAKRFVGLVPDAEYHGTVLDVLHDLVVEGERRLQAVLETREDFKADGFRFDLTHEAPRALAGLFGPSPKSVAGAEGKPEEPPQGEDDSADAASGTSE